ncbi:hypothetical protein OAX78_04740, partial [Planctomycetota bacterium]|nr:hypothetical protein [Planctomycetota bacterium]
ANALTADGNVTYEAPEGWTSFAPAVPGTLFQAHQKPDQSANVYASWEPRTQYLPADAELVQDDTFIERFKSDYMAQDLIEHFNNVSWTTVQGHPTIEARATLKSNHRAFLWVAFTQQRVLTVSVIYSPRDESTVDLLKASIVIEGQAIEQPTAEAVESDDASNVEDTSEETSQARARREELDGFDGRNFPIDEDGWADRTSGLLQQFGLFERVTTLEIQDPSQRADPLRLLPDADAQRADLMLVGRLRRNKVSYMGVTSVGKYMLDFAAWLTFWFPSAIWPGVNSEDYRSDVELVAELIDVRSRQVLFRRIFSGEETRSLSTPDRGWIPGGVLWTGMFGSVWESMFNQARPYVSPGAWLKVEHDMIQALYSDRGFKFEIDKQTFEDRVNRYVNDKGETQALAPRRQAIVVGVNRYSELGHPTLRALAEQNGVTDEALQRFYADDEEVLQGLEPGMRPYAEADAGVLANYLVQNADFGTFYCQDLLGADATRVNIKAGLRRIAKARRRDPVFLYLNLETLVVDDPSGDRTDNLKKYLLPWDVDLQSLELIRQIEDRATLDEWMGRYSLPAYGTGEGEEAAGMSAEALLVRDRQRLMVRHMDLTAISFDWLDQIFNRDARMGLEDHRYIQSREVMMILDCQFPGKFTGMRYAPERAALSLAVVPSSGNSSAADEAAMGGTGEGRL